MNNKLKITAMLIVVGVISGGLILAQRKEGIFGFDKSKIYYAYVPNAADGTVSVIDTNKGEVIKKINIGASASDGIAVSKDGKLIYAGDVDKGNVFVINSSSGEKVAEIKTGLNVHGLDITPDGKYVYVTSGDLKDGKQYNYVSIIDTNTNKTVGQITSDWKSPSHIDFSTDGKFAYISNVVSNEVAIVDTESKKILKMIPVGNIPNETEPSIDGSKLYVANVGDGTLSVIDLENYKTVNVIKAGKGTHGIAVSKNNKYVWVANRTSKDVAVIDAASGNVIRSIELGGVPNHLSIVPNTNLMYVSNKDLGEIEVIDMNSYKVIKKISIGKEPHEIDFASVNSNI